MQEVAKPNNKERYPPKTIYQIVCSLRRYIAEKNPGDSTNHLDSQIILMSLSFKAEKKGKSKKRKEKMIYSGKKNTENCNTRNYDVISDQWWQ